MCTLSFVSRASGYLLGMNRDECRSRAVALPPIRRAANGRTLLGPTEPGGGTWLTLNDAGVSIALVNWYSIRPPEPRRKISRGTVVVGCGPCVNVDEVELTLSRIPLERVQPFRMIAFFLPGQRICEWRWDTRSLERTDHAWRSNLWASSGYDESEAQGKRAKTFERALGQTSAGTLSWMRRLHCSHRPRKGPFSICMHRPESTTVSYTEVAVRGHRAMLRYVDGAPCLGGPVHVERLQLIP